MGGPRAGVRYIPLRWRDTDGGQFHLFAARRSGTPRLAHSACGSPPTVPSRSVGSRPSACAGAFGLVDVEFERALVAPRCRSGFGQFADAEVVPFTLIFPTGATPSLRSCPVAKRIFRPGTSDTQERSHRLQFRVEQASHRQSGNTGMLAGMPHADVAGLAETAHDILSRRRRHLHSGVPPGECRAHPFRGRRPISWHVPALLHMPEATLAGCHPKEPVGVSPRIMQVSYGHNSVSWAISRFRGRHRPQWGRKLPASGISQGYGGACVFHYQRSKDS